MGGFYAPFYKYEAKNKYIIFYISIIFLNYLLIESLKLLKKMSKNKLRFIIRKIINEIGVPGSGWDSNNDITLFHGYPSGVQKFPYGNTDLPENLPNINDKDYIENTGSAYSFEELSQNKDVYNFPMDEFKIGMKIETKQAQKQNCFNNVFDVAYLVIENLKEDPQYYSKLQNPK